MTGSAGNFTTSRALPSYRNPPIDEVVCGMQFYPSDKLRIPHVGCLWERLRSEYPNIQHAPPIGSTKGEVLVDKDTGIPFSRVWFISGSDDQLVQFQMDRFYFNWRRRQAAYPRYEYVIEKFEAVFKKITEFFAEFKLGELTPRECELTYINHIPKGQGWDTVEDLPRVFTDFVWKQKEERFLPHPDKFAWNAEFPFPTMNGSLTASLKQAIRIEDKVPLLVLELKTRGIGKTVNKKAIREWFDTAREWIVRGFADLTTPEIQEIWEREKND